MYELFGINKELENEANNIQKELEDIFKKINEDAMYNSQKVLVAFQRNEVSEMHFGMSTGYGEGDIRKKMYREYIFGSTWSRR